MSASSGPSVRLGAGAGFAGDRIDPAVELATHGALDYLVFECLGERTVAAGQARRRADPRTGFDPMLSARLRAVLPACRQHGTTIITNSGAANPLAAGDLAVAVAADLGLHGLRVAVVTGDDVLDAVLAEDPLVWETGAPVSSGPVPLSANAYLGHEPITQALAEGADVVITGRVADPSLYLAALRHEHGWGADDWEAMGTATMVGHLLECAGQLTGGYFADPVTKPVPGMARLGFPFADVTPDGAVLLGKLARSGGLLDRRTCREQLLYEVGDPAGYLTPDVVADFSGVRLLDVGPDRVSASGATGRPRPDSLKVTLGHDGGWVGEGQISYAGPRCLARARLAGDIVLERLTDLHGLDPDDVGIELIGAGAAFRGLAVPAEDAQEVRLRVAARVGEEELALLVGHEVESLYTNGPAGGGGARSGATSQVSVRSCLLPRTLVTPQVEITEVP
ncbi:acyclic terpene utilization AtuA family protein [uncultured Nocardioides sp.]|uniref:acyclic terpene utilization AtuA family protein n=1 Tax=uncultured Nocardioides sp. TaxID=198441 RepID=UPI0026098890|nr:acyclic terpene utilization AtuA family protein [uncultured Nocardioides sp.]